MLFLLLLREQIEIHVHPGLLPSSPLNAAPFESTQLTQCHSVLAWNGALTAVFTLELRRQDLLFGEVITTRLCRLRSRTITITTEDTYRKTSSSFTREAHV